MAEYSQGPSSAGEPHTRREPGGDGGMEQARERAQEYGSQAREKAQEYGQQAQQKADEGREQAAGGMERAADMVRERVSDNGGMAGEAGGRAADAMESAAGYLRSRDTTEMWSDMENYARTHPAQALAGAVFAGFILGRIIR